MDRYGGWREGFEWVCSVSAPCVQISSFVPTLEGFGPPVGAPVLVEAVQVLTFRFYNLTTEWSQIGGGWIQDFFQGVATCYRFGPSRIEFGPNRIGLVHLKWIGPIRIKFVI